MITPRVLVAGAFGQGNPGDEAILESFVRGLDGCSVTATSAQSDPTPSSTRPCRLLPPDDHGAVASAAMRADLVVITATVFKSLHPSSGRHRLALLANTLALTSAVRARGRPAAMLGVGAGHLPGTSARALARWTARTSGPMQLRDEESAWILQELGVHRVLPVGADVTWSVMPEIGSPAPATSAPHPRLLFTLSHLAGGDRLVAAITDAIRELSVAGVRVAIQPWQRSRDVPMAAAIVDGLDQPVEVLDPPSDLAEAARSMHGTASAVIGLRLHSLVAAGAAGVPFLAIAHEPKLSALACRLGQRSLAPSAGGAELAAACRTVLAGPPPSPAAVHRETQLAQQVMTDARSLAFGRADRRRAGVAMAPVTPT